MRIFVSQLKTNIIMPKSRNRKDHKKKVQQWKENKQFMINQANKQIMKIQEELMEKMKEKQETTPESDI